jgi:hypothetical protein
LTCKENYQSQAAYQELDDLIELVEKDRDDIEEDIKYCKPKTERYIKLCERRERVEEEYDRLSDLKELVNIEINNVENDYDGEDYGNRV